MCKFKYVAVTVFATLLALTLRKSDGLEWSNSYPKEVHNFLHVKALSSAFKM